MIKIPDTVLDVYKRPARDLSLARLLKISLTPLDVADQSSKDGNTPLPTYVLPERVVIHANASEDRTTRIGRCIYCDATELIPNTERPLTDEHIVARGWGGTIVLREASCNRCQTHINEQIEQPMLAGAFLAARRRLEIRGRRRKRRVADYELTAVVNGNEVKLKLPLENHPTTLLLAGFRVARRLGGPGGPGLIFIQAFDSLSRSRKNGIGQIDSPEFDILLFCQMLAKIAHGYAVWRIGMGNFTPLLPDFITRKFEKTERYPECYELIGGLPVQFAPDQVDELHWLGHVTTEYQGKRLLVVGIRLLANLGAPIYWVVAGEMVLESLGPLAHSSEPCASGHPNSGCPARI